MFFLSPFGAVVYVSSTSDHACFKRWLQGEGGGVLNLIHWRYTFRVSLIAFVSYVEQVVRSVWQWRSPRLGPARRVWRARATSRPPGAQTRIARPPSYLIVCVCVCPSEMPRHPFRNELPCRASFRPDLAPIPGDASQAARREARGAGQWRTEARREARGAKREDLGEAQGEWRDARGAAADRGEARGPRPRERREARGARGAAGDATRSRGTWG